MDKTFLSCAITEIFLILFTLSIKLNFNFNAGREHQVKNFGLLLYSFLIALLSNIVCSLHEGNFINIFPFLYKIINSISLIAILFGALFWFNFVLYRLNPKIVNSKYKKLLIIPLIITLIINIISIFTGWIFTLDINGNYMKGKFFFIHIIGCYFYLIIPAIYALVNLFKTKYYNKKIEYALYIAYVLPAIIAFFLEEVLPAIPVLYLCVFSIILSLYLLLKDSQIYHDVLTGLYNRRRFIEYMHT